MTNPGKIEPESQAELNLLDLFIVLLKYKWLIISFVLVTTIIASGYFYLSNKRSERNHLPHPQEPFFFYSECLIEPEQRIMEKLKILVYRRNFVSRMVEENNLLLEIEQAILKEKKFDERVNNPPTKLDVYHWIRQNLFITTGGNVLTIGLAAAHEELPPKIINGYISSLSEYFRKRDIGILVMQENFLRGRLASAHDPILKSRIADEIIRVMDKERIVQNAKYYGFELLDPPSLIDRVRIIQMGNEKKIEKLKNWATPLTMPKKPKYAMLIILLVLVSLVVSISLAFFLEYMHNMKTREPEKMAALKRYLSIRGK